MDDTPDARVAQLDGPRSQVRLTMDITRFRLPPVESALVIGRRAGIGPKAMAKALEEMLPGEFELIEMEHDVIEAVLLRAAHLRRVPRERLLPLLVRNCENLMDSSEMLHFDIDVRLRTVEELEV